MIQRDDLMNSDARRDKIDRLLDASEAPIKGSILAKKTGVTRQIIVKDIAILRAQGKSIISTSEGYMKLKGQKYPFKKVLAVCHNADEIADELNVIVKCGGIIEDVIVEHELYGEIRGMLMLKTTDDVKKFIDKIEKSKSEPLMTLTGGVHLHTISAESNEIIKSIEEELKKKNYLII